MRVGRSWRWPAVAAELGYQAIMLAAPPYALPEPRRSWPPTSINVAEQTRADHPLQLSRPAPASTWTSSSSTGLADVEAICAIKELSGSFWPHASARHALRQALPAHLRLGRPGARPVLVGRAKLDRRRVELPAGGARRALPRPASSKGDWKHGKEIMSTMMPMIYLLENGGKYIQYVKFGCELAGIPVGRDAAADGRPDAGGKGEFTQPLRAAEWPARAGRALPRHIHGLANRRRS